MAVLVAFLAGDAGGRQLVDAAHQVVLEVLVESGAVGQDDEIAEEFLVSFESDAVFDAVLSRRIHQTLLEAPQLFRIGVLEQS